MCTEIFSAAVAKWKAMDQEEKKEYTDKFKVGSSTSVTVGHPG